MPPGYLGFNSPRALRVRQNGVMRACLAASDSAAAWAAIQAKMPVAIGQQIVAPCRRASTFLIWSIVVSFPLGTRRISSSTSRGAGMTQVPAPHRLLCAGPISTTFGQSLSSASFSRQVFFFAGIVAPGDLSRRLFDVTVEGVDQLPRDGPRLAGADRAAVDFRHRNQLGSGAGQAALVRDVQVVPLQGLFDQRHL